MVQLRGGETGKSGERLRRRGDRARDGNGTGGRRDAGR